MGIHQLRVPAVTMSDSMPRLGAAWFHPCVLASIEDRDGNLVARDGTCDADWARELVHADSGPVL